MLAASAWLERRFAIAARGSTWQRETVAGLTTFLAMAYITVANPTILAEAGMDFGAVFVGTCLAAAFGTFAMGWLANYPIALAPGMSQNAFFAYTVVIGLGIDWRVALGAVFISGLLFLLLSASPAREQLINAIPRSLKLGIGAGIGLFLAFIALRSAGVVVASPATLVALGELATFEPAAALAGFALIVALAARRVPGAIVVGMLGIAAIAWALGRAPFAGVAALPTAPAFLQLNLAGALDLSLVAVILSLLLVDIFDTAGTLVGVAARSGLVGADGKLPRLRRALFADSGATLFGALAGTSSTTSYIESAAGVASGGRTGLAAVTTAALFLLCLLFAPLAQSVPACATAAALLFVAASMARGLAELDWHDPTEAVPAALTAVAMPLSFSVADGIGIGFIAYAAAKALAGRPRECPLAVYIVAFIFLLKFALL